MIINRPLTIGRDPEIRKPGFELVRNEGVVFEFARSLGADGLIDYDNENYVEAILRETGGRFVVIALFIAL